MWWSVQAISYLSVTKRVSELNLTGASPSISKQSRTWTNNSLKEFPFERMRSDITHLDFREGLLGVEGDPDGEEVVGVAAAGELHGAAAVAPVNHRQLPEQGATLLVGVVAVALGDHRGVHAVPEVHHCIKACGWQSQTDF